MAWLLCNMENKNLVEQVKKKKEFSQIMDSVVLRAIQKVGRDVKDVRALLRKYFGVFLTNKIIKGVGEEVLKGHISSRNRDYEELYGKILDGGEKTIIDFGCGVNGFSYKYLKKVLPGVRYVGVEVVGQLVDNMNKYFVVEGFNAVAIQKDLFYVDCMKELLSKQEKPRVVFLFQVIDALESFEKDFSKKFLSSVAEECEKIVLSFPVQSLSGKTVFKVKRQWLLDFLDENFEILDRFTTGGEQFLILKNKK